MKVKKLLSIVCLSVITGFCFALGVQGVSVAQAQAETVNLITNRKAFEKALNAAKDDDTLLVGDIDFNQEGEGAVNEAERIIINKNITIKSGKTDGNALFAGASFLLNGTNVAGVASEFKFDGITFDESLVADEITITDWDLSYFGDGSLVSNTPVKCQYAIECMGNTNATFTECEFKNYMSIEGGAINAWYLDGDNSHCKLNISLDGCSFVSNSALNAGGAIYLYAKDNISLSAVNCVFDDNRSGFDDMTVGGGALALFGCTSSFINCEFKNNTANHFYGGNRYFDFGYVPEMGGNFIIYQDNIAGGAIFARDGELSMRNCKLTANSASYGGALALQTITADIEDCLITDNKAISVLEEQYKQSQLGIGSCNGLGGAIYIDGAKNITIGNTEIANNYADSVLGAIYATYDTYDPTFYEQFSLQLLFCSIRDNTCGVKISEIENDSGSWLYDTHAIPYIDTFGCLVLDSIYGEDLPRNELPTEENGFNFFGIVAPEEWYENGHLVHGSVIPTELVMQKLGNGNYYGTFTVGANNHEVIYKFFMDGECKEQVTLGSGELPTLPEFTKDGYTLTGWELAQEMDYQEDRTLIVGNATPSVDVHAIFTPNVYTVTYNFGGMTKEVEQTYGEEIELPEIIEKSNHSFMGFYTQEDGKGTKITSGMKFENVGDITYYAFYKEEFPMFEVIISCIGAILLIGFGTMAFMMYKRRHHKPVLDAVDGAPMDEVKPAPDTSMLSPREKEVLELLLQGKQRNEIATTLYISENTVKKNISGIYTKLNVSSKAELFALFK